MPCTVISVPEGNGDKNERFSFITPELEDLGLTASIEFYQANYRDCIYGFRKISSDHPLAESPLLREKILSAFTGELGPARSTEYWPAWRSWTPNSWDNETFEIIAFDKIQFVNDLRARIEELVKVAQPIADEFLRV